MEALPALVWVVGLGLLWWRAEPLIVRMLTHLESQHYRPDPPAKKERMPIDLWRRIREESEEFARDDLLQKANELYAECGDWTYVRNLLNV